MVNDGPLAASRTALAAQIVYTLGQLPEVNGVSVLVEGRPLRAGPQPGVASRASFASFDPEGTTNSGSGYYVADGRLRQVDGRPVAGPAGDGSLLLRSPALARISSPASSCATAGSARDVNTATRLRRMASSAKPIDHATVCMFSVRNGSTKS